MSEIVPRKKGSGWEARTQVTVQKNGIPQKKQLSAYAQSSELAKERLEEKLAELRAELLSVKPLTEQTTLRSYFQTGYLPTLAHKSKYSRDQAMFMIKHIPFLDTPIKEVTRPMVQSLINTKFESGKFGYWSCFHLKKVLNAALNLAEEDGLIDRNPCRKVTLPPKSMEPQPHLTAGELRRLISYAVHKNNPALPVILLSGLLGIGWDEIRGIEPKHFKSGCILHVPGTKTEYRPRDLYIDPRIVSLIKSHTFPLLGSSNGSELKTIKRVAEPMGISKCGRQALRNTTGTLLQSMDCPLEIRSLILGHSIKSQTMGYSHSSMIEAKTKWLRELVDKVLTDGWESSWESYLEIQGGFAGKSG